MFDTYITEGVRPPVFVKRFIGNSGDNTVMRLATGGTIIATYRTGKNPFGVVFDGANVWSANFGSDSVSTSNTAARTSP